MQALQTGEVCIYQQNELTLQINIKKQQTIRR